MQWTEDYDNDMCELFQSYIQVTIRIRNLKECKEAEEVIMPVQDTIKKEGTIKDFFKSQARKEKNDNDEKDGAMSKKEAKTPRRKSKRKQKYQR